MSTVRLALAAALAAALLAGGPAGRAGAEPQTDAPWVEADPRGYAGSYLYVEPDARDPDRVIRAELTLRFDDEGRPAATYRTCADASKDGKACDPHEVALTSVRIARNHLEAARPLVPSTWPGLVPSRFAGDFIRRFPPSNARGPVDEVLLVDGRYGFRRVRAP